MTILVTGATGTVGRAVVDALLARGEAFRALVHRADHGLPAPAGLDVRHGAYEDAASLDAALDGVERVFLLAPPGPHQRDQERAVLRAAAAAGVGQIVKLSILGADHVSAAPYRRWHAELEGDLAAGPIAWTVLRPAMFMQNVVQMRAPDGNLYVPAGSGRIGWIDVRDIAAAAAAVLTGDGHAGRAYDLTGPEALGFAAIAQQLTEATGTAVAYVDVPPEVAAENMRGAGMPESRVEELAGHLQTVREGSWDTTTDTVERLTGRAPRPFAELARELADDR